MDIYLNRFVRVSVLVCDSFVYCDSADGKCCLFLGAVDNVT